MDDVKQWPEAANLHPEADKIRLPHIRKVLAQAYGQQGVDALTLLLLKAREIGSSIGEAEQEAIIGRKSAVARAQALEEAAAICRVRAKNARTGIGLDVEGQLLGAADDIKALPRQPDGE